MRSKSLLIVGADCTVGNALIRLCQSAGIGFNGTSRRRPVGAGLLPLDLSDKTLASADLPTADIAIICAAANGFANCRADPANAQKINSEAVQILAKRLAGRGSRVVYLSSSAVFDFSRPQMTTESSLCPTTCTAAQKRLAKKPRSLLVP
jgi:dTDP-4-dehydrorhamnose reductase